jgi:thiol-disulfide isomerase/thioredoxin
MALLCVWCSRAPAGADHAQNPAGATERTATAVSKTKTQRRMAARELLAAQKRAEERRKRLWIATAGVAVVLLVVGIMVLVKVAAPDKKTTPSATGLAPAALVKAVTAVPASVLDKVGKGSGLESTPKKLSGKAVLSAGGKPVVLYMGGEFCPYCAAQRWSLAVALSRFGTFTNLGQTASSAADTDPSTPTLTFHGATYTSKYLTFQSVELYSNTQSGNGYATLETPTAAQSKLLQTYTQGGIPFVDFGDQAVVTSVTVDPALLAGMTHQQVADALSDPSSKVGQAEDGSANAFTTIICGLTKQQPSSVCSTSAANAYGSTYGAAS